MLLLALILYTKLSRLIRNLINTKESDLVLFERPRVRDIHTIAKVGNEKSPEFKEAMVKQFIYLFNKRREAKE